MHALIVLAHPEPRSFNGTLKNIAVETLEGAGHTVEVSDLYAEGFDPVEGPGKYARPTQPDLFAPLVEQRHAWETGALPADVRREIERLQRAELPIQYSLYYMGFSVLPPHLSTGMPGRGYRNSDDQVRRLLDRYKSRWPRRLEQLDGDTPIPFPRWDDWDEEGRARREQYRSPMAGKPAPELPPRPRGTRA
jgi:hypothetical protein